MDTIAPAIVTVVRGQMKLWNTLWKWRAKQTIDFENQKLAEFLEDAVRGLVEFDPTEIAIAANNSNTGFAQTQYYNCATVDKGNAITQILQDIIDDFIVSNRDRIKSILMDDEIDGEDDEIDE